MLKLAMKVMWLVCNFTFLRLLEAVEQLGGNIFDEVQALICDPPYNPCLNAELSGLECDRLSLQDISQFVELLSAMMFMGAPGHLFCSALQFKTLYEVFVGEVENLMKEEVVVEDEEAQSQRKTVL